ncbi:hypothetical protein HDU76_005340 [Blyttiomyces sp. JEL0837]|nr:hypothetical protein HDU76_005340 [Blyttiomyces sp. JEL0837]
MGNLALHPEMQESLYQDVKRVTGNNKEPSYKNFNELVYAMTDEDEQTLGPYKLLPQSKINVLVPALHTRPDIWGSDANEFRPDRWLIDDDNDSSPQEHRAGGIPSRYKNAFVPFSEGPRGCLGKTFAQVEFVAILSMLALKYTWAVKPGTDLSTFLEEDTLLTLKPSKPIPLVFN